MNNRPLSTATGTQDPVNEIKIDPVMETLYQHWVGNPFRPKDELDEILLGTMSKQRHERRMREIRELDIESWARDLQA